MQRLFVSKISEALDSLGIQLDGISIHVNPVGQSVFLRFRLRVVQASLAGSIDVEPTVKGLIEKLVREANESIGQVYGVTFIIEGIGVEQGSSKRSETSQDRPKLVLNVPSELEGPFRRIGRGVMIFLRDWRIPVASLTLSVDTSLPRRATLVVKLKETIEQKEKESLAETLKEKLRRYIKLLIKSPMGISVRILDPSDKVVARAMKKAKLVEKEVETLIGNEDVRAIMKAFGKL